MPTENHILNFLKELQRDYPMWPAARKAQLVQAIEQAEASLTITMHLPIDNPPEQGREMLIRVPNGNLIEHYIAILDDDGDFTTLTGNGAIDAQNVVAYAYIDELEA